MFLIDHLHRRGLGVILDWVPSHFPSDEHGLAYFDGTHLYEHADPRRGLPPRLAHARSSTTAVTRSAASCSRARDHWLRTYHADGLRVDAVASMLYLDYSREEGEWIPNVHGGRENLEAVSFLRRLNEDVYRRAPRSPDLRGGIHGVADGVAPHGRRRPRIRVQVGHGLDARHAAAPPARADPPSLPPRRAHVPAGLRLLRELRAPAVARRGRPRQGLAPREDAGGRLATVRQPAAAARLPVGTARQEAPVHGRRARPGGRVGPRCERRMAPARRSRARGHRPLGARPERAASVGTRAARARRGSARLRVDRRRRRRRRNALLPPARRGRTRHRGRGDQPHADAARAIPDRPAGGRSLARGTEQ